MSRKGPNYQGTSGNGLRKVILLAAGALLAACTSQSANGEASQPTPVDRVSGWGYRQAFGVNCKPDENNPKTVQIVSHEFETDPNHNYIIRGTLLGVACKSESDGSIEKPLNFVAIGDDTNVYDKYAAVVQVGGTEITGTSDSSRGIGYYPSTGGQTINVHGVDLKELYLDPKNSDYKSPNLAGKS